jgi:uncharacterized FlaG/YvyC family protein
MAISSVTQQEHLLASTPQPVPQGRVAERKQLMQAVREVNKSEMLGEDNELTFVMDLKARQMVMRVVNRQTDEVVFQIPQDYVLRMAEELKRNS